MKVKEIVSLALVFLDKEDLLDFKPFGEEDVVPELEGKEIDHILKCFNLVYNEVATAYIPLLFKEEVTFTYFPFDEPVFPPVFPESVPVFPPVFPESSPVFPPGEIFSG